MFFCIHDVAESRSIAHFVKAEKTCYSADRLIYLQEKDANDGSLQQEGCGRPPEGSQTE